MPKGSPPADLVIAPLAAAPATLAALCSLLIDTVAAGGSVSFMHPLAPAAAAAFWDGSLAAAARGERLVLGAWTDNGRVLAGTVTLILDMPPNQPHRAEIAKMMTRPEHRGRGIATALLHEAERCAARHGRSLLVLDTAADGGAAILYERMGYRRCGEIADYALKPHGGFTATLIYAKRMAAGGLGQSPDLA